VLGDACEYLELLPEQEPEIVLELERSGHACRRDDDLVAAAAGRRAT